MTQNFEVKDLFFSALSERSLFFRDFPRTLGFEPVKKTYSMTLL